MLFTRNTLERVSGRFNIGLDPELLTTEESLPSASKARASSLSGSADIKRNVKTSRSDWLNVLG
jgi:hypothetical protein